MVQPARGRFRGRLALSRGQVLLLDAVGGALAYAAAMVLRFLDEGSIPATYAARLLPWAIGAAALHVGIGWLMDRQRRPRALLAGRPVAPFAVGALVAVGAVLALNYVAVPLQWRLPLSVAVLAPFLAAVASTIWRLAERRQVDVARLLPRPQVELDREACAPTFTNRRVFITGAAGSIGSELARQVLSLRPAALVLLDNNESGLFDIHAELAATAGGIEIKPLMGNVTERRQMADLFRQERPDVLFHAAAYKHVPLVEANPAQGFVTNVLGTLAVCEAAVEAGVERVMVISTDKAVNPSSFYGLTKRAAELIVMALGRSSAGSRVSAVRFVNVLGSRGSVVPTLVRQIDAGGPVTITHPDVQRFFMTISEAASLVLRSTAFGETGSVFVLQMGDELRIVNLAEQLIRMRGLTPGRDIQLSYVGLRPGEKLREELIGAGEKLDPTPHEHIKRAASDVALDGDRLIAGLKELAQRGSERSLDLDEYSSSLRAVIQSSLPAGQAAA